jgi:hypothetical protein
LNEFFKFFFFSFFSHPPEELEEEVIRRMKVIEDEAKRRRIEIAKKFNLKPKPKNSNGLFRSKEWFQKSEYYKKLYLFILNFQGLNLALGKAYFEPPMFIYLVRAYKVRILQPWSPSLK